jgi:hypothetical protein
VLEEEGSTLVDPERMLNLYNNKGTSNTKAVGHRPLERRRPGRKDEGKIEEAEFDVTMVGLNVHTELEAVPVPESVYFRGSAMCSVLISSMSPKRPSRP